MNEHIPPLGRRGRPPREEVYRRLDTQIAELWQRMGGLPNPLEAADIWRGIWFEEAHHSTAIEGNTLVLKQVEVLLTEGRAVGAKELREYMEVRGYADAAEWVYRQAISPDAWSSGERLTLGELRQVHATTMTARVGRRPASRRNRARRTRELPGTRNPSVPGWHATGLVGPRARSRSTRGSRTSTRSKLARAPFPEDVARLHSRFEQIHPFLDGNGRTGRLVLNLVLVRLGYPPAIIYKRQRTEYLRALQRADDGEPGLLGELLARAILDNLYRFVVPAVAGPARLVPLAALANAEIAADALRTAAIRGRLQATRGPDGQWRSSRNWVNDYLRTRYRRG